MAVDTADIIELVTVYHEYRNAIEKENLLDILWNAQRLWEAQRKTGVVMAPILPEVIRRCELRVLELRQRPRRPVG